MPTVFIVGRYRFYFFSREEERRHIHIASPDGEAKIWLEPEISIAKVINLNSREVADILTTVKIERKK